MMNGYLAFLGCYWLYGFFCGHFVVLVPRTLDGTLPEWAKYSYVLFSALTLLSLVHCVRSDPGRVTPGKLRLYLLQFKMKSQPKLTTCDKCLQTRPERAHHCSACRACVLKMDHHCPWVNNCIGADNQWIFCLLLLYTTCMSAQGLAIAVLDLRAPACAAAACDPALWHHRHRAGIVRSMLATSVLILLPALSLCLIQTCNVRYNVTTIELLRAAGRGLSTDQHSDYVMGLHERSRGRVFARFRRTCGMRSLLLTWLWPCGRKSYLIDDEIVRLSKYNV